MSWRLAESLKKLREQVNAAYPQRDRASDGSIGDAAHASRKSDHNPWVKDARGTGVVTAVDIDADLSPTVKVGKIVDALFRSKDPRIKYIIFNRQITLPGLTGWKKYTGSNPHTMHAHISVHSAPAHYDSRADWNIGIQETAAAEPVLEIPPVQRPPEPPQMPTVNPADIPQLPPVSELQSFGVSELQSGGVGESGSLGVSELQSAGTAAPVGDAPNVRPLKWFNVEDWKPFVVRWLTRVWKGIGGLQVTQFTGLTALGASDPPNWFIYAAIGLILFVLLIAGGLIVSGILIVIWLWNRREILQLKAAEFRAMADPNLKNIGLMFERK